MKNTILFVTLFALMTFGAEAQSKTGNDFILMNNSWNMSRINNYYPYYYSGQILGNNNDHQFSLQYVRSIRNNRALRFSFGYKNYSFQGQNIGSTINDTIRYSFRGYETAMPVAGIGMEYRKMLHKDVMLIGGADFNLGLGRSTKFESETIQYQDSMATYINSTGQSTKAGLGIHAGLTPFTGLRVGWGRFAIGYTATLPFQLNMTTHNTSSNLELDLKFQHSVSVGYRIFNRKKK